MISIKAIFVFLVVSNLFALGVITYNYFTLPRPEANSVVQQGDTPSLSLSTQIDKPKFILDIKYSFDNPKLAAKALAQLDTFTPVPTSYFSKKDDSEAMKYGQAYFGLAETPDYCDKNREAFTENPDIVFEQNHFMTDTAGKSLVRSKVIQEIGHDMHPNIHPNMPEPQKNDFIYTMNRELSNFFTTSDMYLYKQIGQEFSCLAQESNHIPGHSALESKDVLAASLTKYAKKFATKPTCFNYDSLFPETWVLNDKTQCQEFFKYIDTPAFRKQRLERGGISLIRKTVSETGDKTDVRPVNADEEETLRSVYKEGASCGTVKKNQIIQYYVYNPLTINGKKFDFRMFMLAASTNPLIAYYHDGFIRLAVDSADSEAASSFLSTLAPDVKYEVMSFNDLQSHLLKKGLITDSNWLDNYLRPELKRAMVHLMKMSSSAFLKKSSIYELFAVDFIMDSDLKLWFMEVDANPEFVGANDENEKFLVKMLKDHFEVVNGLLKSRMKRVVNYINRQMKDKQIYENNKEVAFKSLEQKTKEFNEIAKNYWEPEYEPGKQNGFKKIIDENFFGVQRNSWILAKECL